MDTTAEVRAHELEELVMIPLGIELTDHLAVLVGANGREAQYLGRNGTRIVLVGVDGHDLHARVLGFDGLGERRPGALEFLTVSAPRSGEQDHTLARGPRMRRDSRSGHFGVESYGWLGKRDDGGV